MDITLYYVEGISESDTPYFATITKQQEFFSNHVVVPSIESSYYPPNYYNEISFDTDDIDVNTKANYLSFDYNNKVYYYFIDAIEYTSENVITLKVKLDAFQTYLFNFNIVGGYIERKFIDRWEDTGNINRNYVRENPSNNLFTKHVKHTQVVNRDLLWIVLKYDVRKAIQISSFYPIFSYRGSYGGECTTRVAIIPVYSHYTIVGKGEEDTPHEVFDTFIAQLGFWANTFDLYFFPYCPVEGINIKFANNKFEFSSDTYYSTAIEIDSTHKPIYGFDCTRETKLDSAITTPLPRTNIKDYVYTYLFNFVKNTTSKLMFDSKFVPALMDSNFYDYNFGNCNQLTKYPLEEAVLPKLINHYYMDIVTGNIIMYIDNNTEDLNDKNTLAIDTNVIHYEIINNAWQEYQQANKYRWLQAFGATGLGAVNDVARPLATKDSMDRKIEYIRTDRKYRTPKRKLVSSWGKRYESNYSLGLQDLAEGSVLGGSVHMLNNAIGYANEITNAITSPSSIKQTGDSSVLGYKGSQVFTYVSKVDNYDECAWYFHRNGYLVNEPITDKNNTLDYVITRYYFNIVKYNDIEVHLNILESNDITDMIKERLLQGVRMWNTDYGEIGDFRYDNVETKYL